MDCSHLLEREEQLEQLRSHARAAAGGSGSVLFVGGEAGVGKSSLIEAFKRRLPSGTVVLAGACDPLTAPRPFAPVLDFAADVSDEFASLVESGAERHALFAALVDSLRQGERLRVLVFEDMHWADDATLDLLRILGRRIADSRAILIVTYRDDEVGAGHPLRRLLGDLARVPAIHRLHVPPLSLEAVRLLIGERPLDPVEVHRRTGGNPYFVTEVLAMSGEGVPVRAGDAVLATVARLSAEATQTLELASLIGQYVDTRFLSGLTSFEAVDECVGAGLLIGRHGRLAFRHEIAREAVSGSISPARRQRLHARLLSAIVNGSAGVELEQAASSDGADVNRTTGRAGALAVLAFHAHEAGDGRAVLRYATTAGRLALRLRAYREARTQLAWALPHAEALPVEGQAQLFEDHGWLCFLVDDMEGAAASRREAAERWQRAGNLEAQVRNLRELGARLQQLGRGQEADAIIAQALALADALPDDSSELADIYNDKAWPAPGDGGSASAWAHRAEDSAIASGNHSALALSRLLSGFGQLLAGRIATGRRLLTLAVETAKNHDLQDVEADITSDAGAVLASQLRFRAADAYLDAAQVLAQDRDLDCTLNYTMASRARSHLYQGRWDEAAADATWVLERANASIIPRMRAMTCLGLLRVRRGDPESDPLLDEALASAMRHSTIANLVAVRAARAEAALARGEAEYALAEASADFQRTLDEGTQVEVGMLAYLIWKSGGNLELPADVDNPYGWQIRGLPLAAARRWRRLGLPYEAARAYAECEEIPQLTEALSLFTGLGARPAAAKTAERLRQLGARGIPRGPRNSTRANPAGLTPREVQVLRLMEKGLRNAEIAVRNRVSQRTVDSQVSSVLGKLDAHSRTEAVAKAHRLGLIDLPTVNAPTTNA